MEIPTTAFKVDRTKYDIKYGSGSFDNLGDKAISDDFELAVALKFNISQKKKRIPNDQLLILKQKV
jgi:hypothetical protein